MIIAFGHRKGVGKSTAAAMCRDYFSALCAMSRYRMGFPVVRSFADPLKKTARLLYPRGVLEPEQYEICPGAKDVFLPHYNLTARQILQQLGGALRCTYRNTLVDLMEEHLTDFGTNIIDDLRMPNEFAMLKRRGAFCVLVTRPGVNPDNDVTETALCGTLLPEQWDYNIINDGDLDNLRRQVEKMVDLFLKPEQAK